MTWGHSDGTKVGSQVPASVLRDSRNSRVSPLGHLTLSPLETATGEAPCITSQCCLPVYWQDWWKSPGAQLTSLWFNEQPLVSRHKAQQCLGRNLLLRGLQLFHIKGNSCCTCSFPQHTRNAAGDQQRYWAGGFSDACHGFRLVTVHVQKERLIPCWGPSCPGSRSALCTSPLLFPQRISRNQPQTACHLQGRCKTASGSDKAPCTGPGGLAPAIAVLAAAQQKVRGEPGYAAAPHGLSTM